MNKKLHNLAIIFVLFSMIITGCTSPAKNVEKKETPPATDEEIKKIDIKLLALKGPTGMGLSKLIEDSEKGLTKNNYTIEIVNSPEDIISKAVKNDADIICMPSNMSSVLWNKTEGKFQTLAINTLGVLYLVAPSTTEEIKTISDLKGKTIIASGKGASPEYALNYILSKNGLETGKDVNIEWKSEHSEVISSLQPSSSNQVVGLLPEPFVTIAKTKLDNLKVPINLTDEWGKIDKESQLITGVAVASKDFTEKNKDQINMFLEEYKNSVDYVNDKTEQAGILIEKHKIFDNAKIASSAIKNSNLVVITGEEMQKSLSGYLAVLYNSNPKSVGGKLPDDEFYYKNK